MSRFEVFVECPDYPDLFWIGNKGTLFSLRSYCDVTLTANKKGYLNHATKIGGRKGLCVLIRSHVQVAKAFVPNPDNKPFVNHIDADKENNSWDNLEWVTNLENIAHAKLLGLHRPQRGWTNSRSKLTKCQVIEIIQKRPQVTLRSLAQQYGVDKETIRLASLGRTYQMVS